jgi:hypothetical protein
MKPSKVEALRSFQGHPRISPGGFVGQQREQSESSLPIARKQEAAQWAPILYQNGTGLIVNYIRN